MSIYLLFIFCLLSSYDDDDDDDIISSFLYFRQKIGSGHSEGLLIQSMPNGIAIEFERSPTMERMKLVLSEIFLINAQVILIFSICLISLMCKDIL